MNRLFIALSFIIAMASPWSVFAQSAPTNSRPAPIGPSRSATSIPTVGTLELVTSLDFRPGNVDVSPRGVVFTTVHPLTNPDFQLVKITGENKYEPWPSAAWQRKNTEKVDENKFDSPLGILIDARGWLWVTDMGQNLGQSRLFAFDTRTGREMFRYTIPADIAPPGSFLQDLVVDEVSQWVYLADINKPGIVAVNTRKKTARRIGNHPSFEAENVDLIIDGKGVNFRGKPARVAIDPITLSADRETIFYGALTGKTWYSIQAAKIRSGMPDSVVLSTIKRVGEKPISDGCATDLEGNHFFTNLPDKGIDQLSRSSRVPTPLVRDPRLLWPDNIRFGPNRWLYIAVNQLHKSVSFAGREEGTPPYYIFRVYTGTRGK